LRWFVSDLMEARAEYLLEADRDRTIVHHIAGGELFGLMRLMKPVAALLARSERSRTVKSLRRALESGYTATPWLLRGRTRDANPLAPRVARRLRAGSRRRRRRAAAAGELQHGERAVQV